jgi:hypothetical protein
MRVLGGYGLHTPWEGGREVGGWQCPLADSLLYNPIGTAISEQDGDARIGDDICCCRGVSVVPVQPVGDTVSARGGR